RRGLEICADSDDAQLHGPAVKLDTPRNNVRFLRLRASVRYAPNVPAGKGGDLVNQWYWHGQEGSWNEKHSRSSPIKQDGKAHVYWTFLPTSDLSDTVAGLRFDPANVKIATEIEWLAVDSV